MQTYTQRTMQFVLLLLATCNYCMMQTHAAIDLSQINVTDIQQQLPDFAKTNITLDDVKTTAKNMCIEQQGAENGEIAYQDMESAAMNFSECAMNMVNITAMQAEIEEASPKGELDVVFHKYCLRRPEAITCIESFTDKLEPCLNQKQRDHKDVFMRIGKTILDFVCYKGGDQIALFVAEGGFDCMSEKKDAIQECATNVINKNLPAGGVNSPEQILSLFSNMTCDVWDDVEACAVGEMETCPGGITPANIVEAMFTIIKKDTLNCTKKPETKSGAGRIGDVPFGMTGNNMMLALIGALFYYVVKRLERS